MGDSTSLVLYDPRTADPEEVALAGFLAGYTGPDPGGPTPWTCASFAWCPQRHLRLFDAHRSDMGHRR